MKVISRHLAVFRYGRKEENRLLVSALVPQLVNE